MHFSIINLEHTSSLHYICIGKRIKEGNEFVPFFFIPMATETQIQQIEQWVKTLLETETEYFCVSIKIKPTNNIKVFLDGDNGLSIEKCVQFNRKLYKMIEESNQYPEGDFSLEVSSPGLDEPLKLHRQYVKNIGRIVEVVFTDGSKKEGKLIAVADADIIVEHTQGKGKKAITQQLVIPFNHIKTTTVQIKF
ncbi:ribosome maturation factor RimP [mine drainage metagenome]|uniref:Ribosome maturation factor RimP n=1 Tax=mine drainage metagenome TaxID=410659 RepID=A0A1J5SU59_9ZZZZ